MSFGSLSSKYRKIPSRGVINAFLKASCICYILNNVLPFANVELNSSVKVHTAYTCILVIEYHIPL